MNCALSFSCVLVLFHYSSSIEPRDLCHKKSGIEWVKDPSDCKSFYLCMNGQTFKYVCPNGEVWNHDQKVCVAPGSALDVCSIQPTTTTTNTITTPPAQKSHRSACRRGQVRSAHEDNCAQYYECMSKRTSGVTDPELMECPYPLMYDEDVRSCQFPKKVKCGKRWTPMDPCDYLQNKCRSAQCVPCHLRFPSCKGKLDGVHPWTGKEWTPNYIVCDHERVTYTGMCEMDKDGKRKLFNPDKKSCTERIIIQFKH